MVKSDKTDSPNLDIQDLKSNSDDRNLEMQIAKFVTDFTIETTPEAVISGSLELDKLSPGRCLYIAHPPKASLEDVIEASIKIQKLGYNAVPHLVARKINSVSLLQETLIRLQDSNVSRILVVGGDQFAADRAFDSSLDIFYTGMLERFGFQQIGFAGHPEGSRNIGASILRKALVDKLAYAAQSPSDFYILTQFGFDAGAVISFEKGIRSLGYEVPVHVGMAGKTQLRQLLKYAVRCGVRSSLGLLIDRSEVVKGMVTSTPDGLVRNFAEYMLSEPRCLFNKAHFFAFGSFENTVNWANAVASAEFSLDNQNGFETRA